MFRLMALAAVVAFGLIACDPDDGTPDAGNTKTKLTVFAAYATPIEEPWDKVIHEALIDARDRGQIDYTWHEAIGYDGSMEGVLREAAGKFPDAIFGDAFGNEEAVRKVAAEFPAVRFVFGSGFGPAEPNLSVFDNWIHEPAYLCGMLAGKLTTSGKIGVVGGMAVAEVNRIVNAFIAGAKETNPEALVYVDFIDSWYDPTKAASTAEAQVTKGADVLFAERAGVIEVAKAHGLLAFGNMSDQNAAAPQTVVTGPVWNMRPTVQYVVSQIHANTYTAQDLKDFSMMAKGGASLAPFHGFAETLDPNLLTQINERSAKIMSGLFRVPILEEQPPTD